jgi:hypothetical protein
VDPDGPRKLFVAVHESGNGANFPLPTDRQNVS